MNESINIEGSLPFCLLDQIVWLLPQKAMYWQEKKILIIADLHLGKAGHFRKSGIPIPAMIHQDDLSELNNLINHFKSEQVLILGDLFHSIYNKEWEDFDHFLHDRPNISFVLVKGNHDILPAEAYEISNLDVVEDMLIIAPFCFSHKPAFTIPSLKNEAFIAGNKDYQPYYNLCGHVHPGISIQGNLGQKFRMPCFYFSSQGGILPAFGKFTGYKCLKKTSSDSVFGVAEISSSKNKVFKVA